MIGKLYKWFWSDVLKLEKPITHITRDEQKANPLAFMLIFLAIGIIMVKFSAKYWWQALLWLLAGIVMGHIFW